MYRVHGRFIVYAFDEMRSGTHLSRNELRRGRDTSGPYHIQTFNRPFHQTKKYASSSYIVLTSLCFRKSMGHIGLLINSRTHVLSENKILKKTFSEKVIHFSTRSIYYDSYLYKNI